jgi:hypothetical protein
MPSVNYSSNIRSANTVVNASTDGGNRLNISIPSSQFSASGLSAGNAIYYSTTTTKYEKSKADNPVTSEVLGVIEGFDALGNANVVLYGSIALTGSVQLSTGGDGGHDIFFLSGQTAGILQSLAPTNENHIIKAVYQTAPHGNYTGVVMNYIGYKVPVT